MKIYLASSWRNVAQPALVQLLRALDHDVYDFRNPAPGVTGFAWSDVDPEWESWDGDRFRAALAHPVARDGFRRDMDALLWCDACVLLLPCGRSAHLELGWATGAGKLTIAVLADAEPELMYAMVDHLVTSVDELLTVLALDHPLTRLEVAT